MEEADARKQEIAERLKERESDDLTTPHNCMADFSETNMGTDIQEEHAFQMELHDIVEEMTEKMVHETRILEGTLVPEYKNELSDLMRTQEQCFSMNDSLSGFSTIDPTPISTPDSNSLFCFVRRLNPDLDTRQLDDMYMMPRNAYYVEMLDVSGCETDVTNEYSECTVPMISEPMDGTPSEAK